MNCGVFKIAYDSEAKGSRNFHSRFVDTFKSKGHSQEFAKARLVVHAFNDKIYGLLTYTFTVQRMFRRLFRRFVQWTKKFSFLHVMFLKHTRKQKIQLNGKF